MIAYPNIGFGQKPWREHGSSPASAPILERDIVLSYAYDVVDMTGSHNVTASAWVTSGQISTASDVVAEVMIWTERTGSITPSGDAISTVTIAGRNYTLWRDATMSSGGNSWTYYAFVPDATHRSGSLPIRDFLQHLVDEESLSASSYLANVDFGAEVVSGSGEIVVNQAQVSNMTGVWIADPISAFSFPDTVLPSDFGSSRVTSEYVDIPGLEATPRPFTVTSTNGGNPAADPSNVTTSSVETDSGEVQFGTNLVVDVPAPGESNTITLTVDGVSGTWTVSREEGPSGGGEGGTVGAFSFPDTVLGFEFSATRVTSEYVDIPGLDATPRPFTVTSTDGGNPTADPSNVTTSSVETDSGEVQFGTNLVVDVPAPGQSNTITLTVDGVSGTWTVSREESPSGIVSDFEGWNLSTFTNNYVESNNYYQINFADAGLPDGPYNVSYTVSRDGSEIASFSGPTSGWGFEISLGGVGWVDASNPSPVTYSVIIDGEAFSWEVSWGGSAPVFTPL